MTFPSKKKKPSRAEAIDAFWKFWPTIAEAVAASVGEHGMKPEHVSAMSEHVSAIDSGLDWEMGPGRTSKHHLCLSGKGDPVLRTVAEQWLHRAPPPSENWEYYAARQPHRSGGLVLEIAGEKIALDDLVCAATEDESCENIDIVVHHPAFATIEDENLRGRILFIGLDTLLGEDDVERWLGVIEPSKTKPEGAFPLQELPRRIETFKAKCTGDKWAVLKGTKDGKPIFVSKNTAIKRIDHLLLDMHVEIVIPLGDPRDDGLTTSDEADVLNAMEDALFGLLGKEAAYIARETYGGVRTMHLHVMEGGPAAAAIETWRTRNPAYPIEVKVRSDPRWEVLQRWD